MCDSAPSIGLRRSLCASVSVLESDDHVRVPARKSRFGDQVPPWTRSFDLTGVPIRDELNLELESDTFVPAESVDGSTDHRTLGIMVRSIRLSAETDSVAP